jgi:hypothetical protein
MMLITSFPDYLMESFMKPFLSHNEWHLVMNTTKKFASKKKSTIYLSLNNHFSKEFCLNKTFRIRVLSILFDKHRQLAVNLHATSTINSKHLSVLDGLHFVDLSNNQQITDVNMLENVMNLDLTGCSSVHDVSRLGKVQKLLFSRCYELKSLKGLENAKEVNLSGCHFISDVSPLTSAMKVNLSHCVNIADVSALKNVEELVISHCNRVQDVNKLSSVKKLDASYCDKLYELNGSALKGCSSLNFNYCKNLKVISNAKDLLRSGKVKEISLVGCKGINDLSSLVVPIMPDALGSSAHGGRNKDPFNVSSHGKFRRNEDALGNSSHHGRGKRATNGSNFDDALNSSSHRKRGVNDMADPFNVSSHSKSNHRKGSSNNVNDDPLNMTVHGNKGNSNNNSRGTIDPFNVSSNGRRNKRNGFDDAFLLNASCHNLKDLPIIHICKCQRQTLYGNLLATNNENNMNNSNHGNRNQQQILPTQWKNVKITKSCLCN